MPVSSFVHAALSAAAVGLLLVTLRSAGPRAGGLAAAVPINSIPALFWLSLEHGGGYATSAVVGSLWGTGLTVLLGTSFARLTLAVQAAMPRRHESDPHRGTTRRTGTALSMAAAGAMSLVVTELSRHSGPQLCGLVAAVPIVGLFALRAGYRQGGAPLMLLVLGGYLDGMAAKAAFLAALALAWAVGAGAWAWPIALAAAALALRVKHVRARAHAAA
ncbi:MAG TPA: hypothetical protein VLD35_19940 [Caldimonas sp.]|nr:hypothetical protein [Caldimonas sp.]